MVLDRSSKSTMQSVRPVLTPRVRSANQAALRPPQTERELIRRELDALLRVHEPSRTAIDVDRLLAAYPGMERELLACYRQYYAPDDEANNAGNFRGVRLQLASNSSRPVFQLPKAAVPTFLRAKRQAAGGSSKSDDIRSAVEVVTPVSTTRRRSIASPNKQDQSAMAAAASNNAIDLSANVSSEGLRPARRPEQQ